MLKNKTTFRIVLLLCVVIFMIGAVAGCYNPDDNEVNATYIRCTNIKAMVRYDPFIFINTPVLLSWFL